jgi:hypothetical protein
MAGVFCGLHQRGLEAGVAAMQIAHHQELDLAMGLGRKHVDVLVEEGLALGVGSAGGKSGKVERVAEPAVAVGALPRQRAHHPCHQLHVAFALLGKHVGVGGKIPLRLQQQRMVGVPRLDAPRLVHDQLALGDRNQILVVERHRHLEQVHHLVAELLLFRMDHAVGADQLVDGAEDGLLVGGIEALEQLEAPQLELGQDELLVGLALRNGLREMPLHQTVEVVEHPVEVLRPFARLGLAHRFVVQQRKHAVIDQLADVRPDKLLLDRVEARVDVAKSHHAGDDGLHLVLGDVGVGAEIHHDPAKLPRNRRPGDPLGHAPGPNRQRSLADGSDARRGSRAA